jgi:hypothetical protein
VRYGLAGIIAALCGCVAGHSQDATTPRTTTQPAAAAPRTPERERVERILERLEQRSIDEIQADLSWRVKNVYDEDSDAITKLGKIWYRKGKPSARFLVELTAKISGGRKDKLDERHLFDGQWYVELRPDPMNPGGGRGTVTRTQIRRAEDTDDPFRLGEGPFPVPFGQRKDDILREFDVTLVPPESADPPGSDHLRLMPRPGSRTGETYARVDFWISHEGSVDGLPVQVRAEKKDPAGQVNAFITITFTNVGINQAFAESLFKIETPPGFHETVEPIK